MLLILVLLSHGCSNTAKPEEPRWRVINLPDEPMALPRAKSPSSHTEHRLSDASIPWDANPVMIVLSNVAASVVRSRYASITRVNEAEGEYDWDCSGMVKWILDRAAPQASTWMKSGLPHRPLAANYQKRIAKIGDEPSGWRKITKISEAEPGDVIAWSKPAGIESNNTGHVVFVARRPVPVEGSSDTFLIRVIDSTSLHHADDSRLPGQDTGFGFGTILLVADSEGAPRAYGWLGAQSNTFVTNISIGRTLR